MIHVILNFLLKSLYYNNNKTHTIIITKKSLYNNNKNKTYISFL
jgi:hypothetical protein